VQFKYVILSVILGINLAASVYVSTKQDSENYSQLESKLFELYFGSVAGLYGFATQNSNLRIRESEADRDGNF
jgi:hypothetical protein